MSKKRNSNWTEEMDNILRSEFPKSRGLSSIENLKLKSGISKRINELRKKEGLQEITWKDGIWKHAHEKLGLKWDRSVGKRGDETLLINTIWRDETFVAYAQKLIKEAGILKKKNGLSRLQRTLNAKFFKGERRKITKKMLALKIDDLIWTKEYDKLVSDVVGARGNIDSICDVLHFIPREFIDKRAHSKRGMRPKGVHYDEELFQAGVGRILTNEEMRSVKPKDMPHYTFDNPYVIDVDPNRWDSFLLNSPHIGAMYNPLIDENWVRNFVRIAEATKTGVMIIPSGFIWLDVTISGTRKSHRSEISGLDHDLEYFDPDYKTFHNEILEELELKDLDIEFVTTRENIKEAIYGGYRKVMLHKDGSPIFNGLIFILLDKLMEDIIESGVQAFVRYITRRMRNQVEAREKVALALLIYARKEEIREQVVKYQKELEKLERLRNRYIMTYAGKPMQRRYRKIIRTELINWIEEAIPNSKVISMGDVVFQMGKKGLLIDVRTAKHKRVSENELGKLLEASGSEELRGKKADVIITASAFSPHASWSRRENPRGKERRVTDYIQLPVAVDGQYVRSQLHHLIGTVDQLEGLINHPRFEGAAIRLRYASSSLLSVEKVSIDMVRKRWPKGASVKQPIATPYFYALINGDIHKGSKSLVWFFDPKQNEFSTLENAIAKIFMRTFVEQKHKLPIHALLDTGDGVEGDHYGTSKTVHPLTQLLGDEQRRWKEVIVGADNMSEAELRDVLKKMHKHSITQQMIRGEDWPMRQLIDMFRESLRTRAPFFHEILKSFRRAQLKISGVNEILGEEDLYDWRDMAPITIISGQHLKKSMDSLIQEGPLYSLYTIPRILALKECEFSEEELERLVRGPLFEQDSIAYGVLSFPKDEQAKEYGLTMRHSPSRKGKQSGHPLLNALTRTMETGDYQEIFFGKHLVEMTGDVHRIGAIFGPGITLFSSGPCTHASGFGAKIAVARSTPGAIVIGLPLWGTDAGPIKVMALTHDFIGAYLREPWDVDWNFFFENAL